MKYEEIKVYFEEGIPGIEKLMIKIKPSITTIEDYINKFKGNALTDESELIEALNRLTGLYGEMTIISFMADAYNETNEASELLSAKNNLIDDGKGGKKAPTDEVAKAMSKVNNLVYLRTANLFEAYSRICSQKIMTCQSQLNYLKKPLPPQG